MGSKTSQTSKPTPSDPPDAAAAPAPAPKAGGKRSMKLGALKGLSMEKWMCWGALGVSGVVLLLFLLDLFLGMPFGRLSVAVDILAVLACGLVGYISWDALKDLR